MVKRDSGWRPNGIEEYNGNDVWFHDLGPHEIREGETDGDIDFDEEELDGDVDPEDVEYELE